MQGNFSRSMFEIASPSITIMKNPIPPPQKSGPVSTLYTSFRRRGHLWIDRYGLSPGRRHCAMFFGKIGHPHLCLSLARFINGYRQI